MRIKWKHFPRYWPFVWGIHRSPLNFPHKVQWRGALMFSLICGWTNGWVNNRDAGDLRRHGARYDVIVMNTIITLRLNKRFSKQSRRWCFETPWRSLWRHCNGYNYYADVAWASWRLKAPTNHLFNRLFKVNIKSLHHWSPRGFSRKGTAMRKPFQWRHGEIFKMYPMDAEALLSGC